jgi:cysteinyl-tRNA synthetase
LKDTAPTTIRIQKKSLEFGMPLKDCSAYNIQFAGIMPFVRRWIHNGLMQLGEDKMSKSSGRLVTVSDALAKCRADALRLWMLNSHYRIRKMKLSCVC